MTGAPDDRIALLLRQGDTALVLAQRLSAWCGKGPAFEEDLALTNVALDLIGQTRLWLDYAAELEASGRDADALAFRRDAGAFRNLLLVEQPDRDYAVTVARQFLFDAWHRLRLDALASSADERIAAIAQKSRKEVDYHERRSADLIVRLGDGTADSHARMQAAVDRLWTWTGEMFKVDEVDRRLAGRGIAPLPDSHAETWNARVAAVLQQATLRVPAAGYMQTGGRYGRHTEHLGYLLAEMQFLQRAYPDARW